MKIHYDTTKIGDRLIHSETELFEVFYEEKELFVNRIMQILKRPYLIAETEDIFINSLLIVKEKYFDTGKTDYTELRKLLFGICRIQCFKFIAKENNKCVGLDLDKIPNFLDPTYFTETAHQIWFRKYQSHYYSIPKNRLKKRAYQNTPDYRARKKLRDIRYRAKQKLKNI